MTAGDPSWRCPVCAGCAAVVRYALDGVDSEGGVDPAAFRPSASGFGRTSARVLRCRSCGHGSVDHPPAADAVSAAYADAADPVSRREEAGQVETARRGLVEIERFVRPGLVCDIGCWTGSFLVAARDRGWVPQGVEPSRWASARARERGLEVRTSVDPEATVTAGSCRLVVVCDVLEHLEDPGAMLDTICRLLQPAGAVYLTVPDAGSATARLLGRRWWSVLPMHLQYFTRGSLDRLLRSRDLRVRSMSTHPKVFTARYYAERLDGYSAHLGRAATAALGALGASERLVAPDFRDRVAVVASR